MMIEKATFAAGCFWGVEESFRQLDGVIKTTVGYEGGITPNPTYAEVCSDKTGHAEVVEIAYDPQVITYAQLLTVFWQCHNPTQVNCQGPDIGSQYRSVIFYHCSEQKKLAQISKFQQQNSGKYIAAIATRIEPAQTFYPAEEYHQRYLLKRGIAHCRMMPDNSPAD